ncbi:hypothetical protein [Simiduia aestuariiviva]|uniref:Uncharacterized protein n=1 Tax=Simiduia aestuariiviva TaxID=1510459 RepID=A0A839UG12_9GAMM|nr:hypothetical protein [Simiduia aestuariiviva]MBB3166832.1 hypothetical protein [Simiduia aestuariiviva]
MRPAVKLIDKYLAKEKLRNVLSICFVVIPLLATVVYLVLESRGRDFTIYQVEGEILELAAMQSKYKHYYSYKVRLDSGKIVLATSPGMISFTPGDRFKLEKIETLSKERYLYSIAGKSNGS